MHKKLLIAVILGSLFTLVIAGAALAQETPANAAARGNPGRGGRPPAAGDAKAGATFDAAWLASPAGQAALNTYKQRLQGLTHLKGLPANSAASKQARMTLSSSLYFAQKNATQPHFYRHRGQTR